LPGEAAARAHANLRCARIAPSMKKIEFVFFDAGGGHRSAATSLEAVIRSQERPWQVHLMNLQEQLDTIDIARRFARIRIQEIYNAMLRNGWTLGSVQLMRILQAVIRLYHRPTARLLERYWQESQPDMVVSLVPHFNRALCQSFRNAFPERPFVTILTDLADYPPHFWMERQSQYFICGTERAVEQARALGHPDDHVFRVSGMILNPGFYQPFTLDQREERQRRGLSPDPPTALVLFGGHGSRAMLEIADRLNQSSLELQLILICGRNEKLAQALRGRRSRHPMLVEGFTREVPYYMHLSDFFIGKPGPGSIAEALTMHLPVIVECNAWTLPQERYNTEWIREKQVGCVLPNFRGITSAVAEMLRPEAFARFRAAAATVEHRAVFEIPNVFEKILNRPN